MNDSPFPRKSIRAGDGWRAVRVASCSVNGCGASLFHNEASSGPNASDELLVKQFRRKGWWVSLHGGKFLCPAHNVRSSALTPAQRRAAYCRIEGLPKSKPELPPMSETKPAPAAEPPRQPTIADRRKVSDALEGAYDVPSGRYSKAWTDKKLAAELDVPAAWVRDIRVGFFGEGEGNEASIVRDAAIDDLQRKFDELTAEFYRRAGEIETDLRKLLATKAAA